MKLVTFEINGRSAVGLLNADATAVHPVPGCADMQTLIGLWPALDTVAKVEHLEVQAAGVFEDYNFDVDYVISMGGDGTFLKSSNTTSI